MDYLLLLFGFYLLVKGADYFVKGSSGIAKILRVPPLLIGLTIVAFGTSSPEAAVSIHASLEGISGIAVGNILGSNIFNIAVIIGLTVLIAPLTVERTLIRKEIPFALLASVAILILIADKKLQSLPTNLVSRADGFILILFFLIFLYYLFEVARKNREKICSTDEPAATKQSTGLNSIFTIGGLAGIIIGADLVVKRSVDIALQLGMSEALVGLTIVAIGTSLPELITSITAAVKKECDIAVGNIVGSNIFNIFFILGISSTITPLLVDEKFIVDAIIMIIFTVIFFIFSRTHHKISKAEGILLLASYMVYLFYIISRN